MKQILYTLTVADGLHSRPAGLLVKEAQKYKSSILIIHKGKQIDLKKIFAVMTSGIKYGESISVTIDGCDEEEAADKLQAFFKQNL